MPASGTTNNYKIPIYQVGDTVNFLNSYNSAMQIIDNAINQAKESGDTAQLNINELQKVVESLNSSVTELNALITNFESSEAPVTYSWSPSVDRRVTIITDKKIPLYQDVQYLSNTVYAGLAEYTSASGTKFKVLLTIPNNPLNLKSKSITDNETIVGTVTVSSDQREKVTVRNIIAFTNDNITYFLTDVDESLITSPGANLAININTKMYITA